MSVESDLLLLIERYPEKFGSTTAIPAYIMASALLKCADAMRESVSVILLMEKQHAGTERDKHEALPNQFVPTSESGRGNPFSTAGEKPDSKARARNVRKRADT